MSSCTERERIGWRTQSDQTADAIQSDSGRKPIGRRTQTVGGAAVSAAPTKQTGNLLQLSPLHQPSKLAIYCSCLHCTNQANWQSIAAGSARLCRLPEQELHQPSNKANDTNVGGYGIPAVVTQSLNTNILPLIADLQQIIMVRKNNNGFIGLNGFAGCVESVAILRIQNPHIP